MRVIVAAIVAAILQVGAQSPVRPEFETAAGLLLSLVASRFIARFLHGINGIDLRTYGAVTCARTDPAIN